MFKINSGSEKLTVSAVMDISNTLKDAIKDNLGPLGFGALKGFRYGDIIEDSKKLGEIGFVDEEKVMMIKALG